MMITGIAAAVGHDAGSLDLVRDLAVIMCVAAATTVLFRRIKQPVVLGYLLAGLIVGPHVPVPVFADETTAHTLSELGVILLMFSLGLEFSLRKLVKVGPTAGIVAVFQCSLMIWLGYLAGRGLGWTALESAFTGSLLAISSTTIIVKAFAEQGVKGPLAELVFGILIVEDLIAILLLTILTAIASGAGLSPEDLMMTVGKLAGFLVGLVVVGLLLVPRIMRAIVRVSGKESVIVASVGVCFAAALLARQFGYSVALGAFLGGALVAESGEGKMVEDLIEPVRDVFAAIFFVSVGMLIDPKVILEHWVAVLLLTAIVVVGKIVGVAVGAFFAGHGVPTAVRAGMSLAQIGEFSFIIAGVGLSLGAVGGFLYPIAIAVSALTTLITPFLIRLSNPAAALVDRRLPHALQTFSSLYGSWVARLGGGSGAHPGAARTRRLAWFLVADVSIIAAIAIAGTLAAPRAIALANRHLNIDPVWARRLLLGAMFLVALPFVLGAIRLARALGMAMATQVFPLTDGVDTAAAPRRALVVALQIAILLVAGVPVAAITQPFLSTLPALPGAVVVVLLMLLVVPFWKSAVNLEGHVRAGAQVVLEALASQAHSGSGGESRGQEIARLTRGLGDLTTVELPKGAGAVGRSLGQLRLRGQTGASVIAIDRGENDVLSPAAEEVLREGDVLVLAGGGESVAAAKRLLLEGPES
jgi:CPA2 family monovalent cation:H+ antiporter-2